MTGSERCVRRVSATSHGPSRDIRATTKQPFTMVEVDIAGRRHRDCCTGPYITLGRTKANVSPTAKLTKLRCRRRLAVALHQARVAERLCMRCTSGLQREPRNSGEKTW